MSVSTLFENKLIRARHGLKANTQTAKIQFINLILEMREHGYSNSEIASFFLTQPFRDSVDNLEMQAMQERIQLEIREILREQCIVTI